MAYSWSSSWSAGVGIDDDVDRVVLELGVDVGVVAVAMVGDADVVWDVSTDDNVVAVAVAVVDGVEVIAVPELACGPCSAWPYCVLWSVSLLLVLPSLDGVRVVCPMLLLLDLLLRLPLPLSLGCLLWWS